MNQIRLFEETVKPEITKVKQLADLRQDILRWLMGIILVLGITMATINTGQNLESGNYAFPFALWGAVVYLAVIFILGFYGRGTYQVRSISTIILSYLVALLSLSNYSQGGDHLLWLCLTVLLTSIMLGTRASIAANVVSLLSYVIAGSILLNNNPPSTDLAALRSAWINGGIILTFVNVVISVVVIIILRALDQNLSEVKASQREAEQLAEKFESEKEELENQTGAIEYRLNQTRSAVEITRIMGAILDPRELLQQVADLVQDRFDLYYVGIFTIDERRRYAQLRAGSGQAGKLMLADGHQLAVGGSSMVGWATAHGESRIALNVDHEAVRFRNPHLPLTRSELALPISIGDQTVGAISVQSSQSEAFDDEDIAMLQSIADSLGVAFDNARLFQQFDQRLNEIQHLNRRYLADSWSNIFAEEESVQRSEFDTGEGDIPGDTPEFSVPLTLRGDQVIGNISFATEQSDLSADDREFLEAITNQAALALESARLLDEANKRVEQERALRELTSRFSETLDFDTLLQTIVKEIGRIPLVKEASIHVAPPEENISGEHSNGQPSNPVSPPSPNDLAFN